MFCPRCDKDKAVKFFEAPKDKSWKLYRCRYCDFVWRSTEKDSVKNKDLYPSDFKLSEEKVNKMTDKPAIPPLRRA